MPSKTNRPAARGFTLIEVAIATVIIAVAVTALMVSLGSSTRVNDASRETAEAVLLAQNIREWTIKLPFVDPENPNTNVLGGEGGETGFDDLDDLNGQIFNPPRDAMGQNINDMAGWSQTVQMGWLNDTNLSATSNVPTDVVYVTVEIKHQDKHVLTTSWFVARREG